MKNITNTIIEDEDEELIDDGLEFEDINLGRYEIYRGNPNLKRPGVPINFTPEQQVEYYRCATDCVYFTRKYMKIVNLDIGLMNFDLRNFQEEIITTSLENRFVICKIARQMGKTSAVTAIILWYLLFTKNFPIAVLAHKASQSREILSRIQFAYEYLPIWLQQGVVEWNKGRIELENGSSAIAGATSSSSIRGGVYGLIYLDEFAHVPGNVQETFFNSVYPTISSGKSSKVIITSTPNGMDLFYEIWRKSELGKNSYKRINVHWSAIPGRDEKWKQETIENTSVQQFRQEFDVEFIGSSKTLIDGQILSELQFKDAAKTSESGTLLIFEEPNEYRNYIMTVDVARGQDGDHSAFVVFDVSFIPYRVVCTFYDRLMPAITFPNIITQVAQQYNDAYILVESNDVGGQVADILHYDYEYENLLTTTSSKSNGTGQQVNAGFGGNIKFGFRMTTSTKRVGCLNLKTIIEKGKLDLLDFRIIKELSNFVEKGPSFRAADGHHDDLVMCLVGFGWFATQPYFLEITSSNIKRSVIEKTADLIEDSIMPFGFMENGFDGPNLEELNLGDEELLGAESEADIKRIMERYRL